jgi:hypothetical protein
MLLLLLLLLLLCFFWYPTFVYSTCAYLGDTATLLCYVFLWSMVVDVKLFTREKSYHLDRLFCSRPKLVIHCYLLKPHLIDRAHSNNSNSGLITYYFTFGGGKEAELLPPLCPDLIRIISPTASHPRRRRRGRSNYSCHPLNNDSSAIFCQGLESTLRDEPFTTSPPWQ